MYSKVTPLGPSDAFAMRDTEKVEAEIARINSEFAHRVEHGIPVSFPTVTLVLGDYGLSLAERRKVATLFEGRGWESVTSQTSEENDERPGLISYTFSAG